MGSVAEGGEGLKGLLCGLDEVLLEKVLEWARRAYQAILERVDDLLLGSRGKGLCVEHMRSRWYYTCMGPVRVARRQYRDAVNGGYRYLLDEVVGMEGGSRVTPRLKQVGSEVDCAMPFRRSAEVVEKTMGVRLSLQRERQRRAEAKVGIAYEGWEQVGHGEQDHLRRSLWC